jgi:hypothetical protein
MEFVLFFVLVPVVVVITLFIWSASQKRGLAKILAAVPEFHASDKYVGEQSAIAIDPDGQKICVLKNPSVFRVYSFGQILGTEIVEDGYSVEKTSRGSQAGGVIVGGLLGGGVGAVIGGLSGKKKVSQKVSSIQLKVTVEDVKEPLQTIDFLDTTVAFGGGADRSSSVYQQAMSVASRWQAHLVVAMKQATRTASQQPSSQTDNAGSAPTSVADELVKLADLRARGILTQEEFDSQKSKILSR